MACSPHHDLRRGKVRKDGKMRWKCRKCGRSEVVPAREDQMDSWAMAQLTLSVKEKREAQIVREVMET